MFLCTLIKPLTGYLLPVEVIYWAMRNMWVVVWIARVVILKYEGVITEVRVNEDISNAFKNYVGVYLDSVLRSQLFFMV